MLFQKSQIILVLLIYFACTALLNILEITWGKNIQYFIQILCKNYDLLLLLKNLEPESHSAVTQTS